MINVFVEVMQLFEVLSLLESSMYPNAKPTGFDFDIATS